MSRSYGSTVSTLSAIFLGVTGFVLLFAADSALPTLIPAFPPEGELIGQLHGGSLLAVAGMNWLSRSALIGGIYSRAITSANAVLYFTTALSLLKPLMRGNLSIAGWTVFVVIAAFALIYVWLLFRGPFEHDLQQHAKT